MGKDGTEPRKPRLKYPVGRRAQMMLGNAICDIVDISQTGVKIIGPKGAQLRLDTYYPCMLGFLCGKKEKAEVRLARQMGDLLMMEFRSEIPESLLAKDYKILSGG